MNIWFTTMQVMLILLEIALIAIILLRKADVSGLSSAFGGMGGDSAFGVKTQKQLDKTITWVAAIFLVLAIFINKYNVWVSAGEVAPQQQQQQSE